MKNQLSIFTDLEQNMPSFEMLPNSGAEEIARKISKNSRIIGLTRGQFSLINLIHSILLKVGKSDVIVTTWSAGIKDANNVKWLCDTDLIKSFCLITDHSYTTRQQKYAVQLSKLFGLDNIRTSEIHAKFTLIKSDDLFITIRTSMNLNANRTCESFEIDESFQIYDFYHKFCSSTFGEMPSGFTADSRVVNDALSRTFNKLRIENGTNEFAWQSDE